MRRHVPNKGPRKHLPSLPRPFGTKARSPAKIAGRGNLRDLVNLLRSTPQREGTGPLRRAAREETHRRARSNTGLIHKSQPYGPAASQELPGVFRSLRGECPGDINQQSFLQRHLVPGSDYNRRNGLTPLRWLRAQIASLAAATAEPRLVTRWRVPLLKPGFARVGAGK